MNKQTGQINSLVPSHERLIEKVLKKTEPLAWKIAWEIKNSISGPEDAFHEMQIEQIKTIRKMTDEKSFDDLVCICLSALRFYRLYSFRENSKKRDRADYSVDVTEAEEWMRVKYKSSDRQLEENELMTEVFRRLRGADEKYPGIKRFFEESIDPSRDTLEKVVAYKRRMVTPRGLATQDDCSDALPKFIPPKVLAEVLGITPGKLRTYKNCISRLLVYSGISENLVRQYFDFGTL